MDEISLQISRIAKKYRSSKLWNVEFGDGIRLYDEGMEE